MLAQGETPLSINMEFPADAVFGAGLPPEAELLLCASAEVYDRDEEAESLLRDARRIAPTHPAVLIGLYRFYFYKGRLEEALEIGRACLLRAAIENSLPLDWRATQPADAPFSDYEELWPRFFMFVLKGYAYLNMRLGMLDEGREAAEKLIELDPSDKIGAGVLLAVLDRMGEEDVA
jgi:tetratricopeptide (TPR) repeat protein